MFRHVICRGATNREKDKVGRGKDYGFIALAFPVDILHSTPLLDATPILRGSMKVQVNQGGRDVRYLYMYMLPLHPVHTRRNVVLYVWSQKGISFIQIYFKPVCTSLVRGD